MTGNFSDPKALYRIANFATLLSYIENLHLTTHGEDLISDKTNINKKWAVVLSSEKVVVRPKWISDLKAEMPISYDRAYKVFMGVKALLAALKNPEELPETALVKVV